VLGDRYTRSGDSGTFADSEFDGWRGGFAWLESVHGLRVKPDNSSQFGIVVRGKNCEASVWPLERAKLESSAATAPYKLTHIQPVETVQNTEERELDAA